jgi:diadenylate cyclase
MKEMLANIMAGVEGIGFTDILDILVVAFIVYKVLGFINDTRAQQLVQGIFILLFAYVVSDLLSLHTLNWILKGTMAVGVIALIILFQPELRRGLEYMGRGKLSLSKIGQMNKENAKYITDEFVKAVDYFSTTRTGALIIIEREVSLGDIAESGTVINADISAEVIENIFYTGAPLHDGALIVRGEKLYAAGCVLPLSTNPNINKELGTRHRAGLGITENSDAIAIIVSEESGIISFAGEGKLTRFLNTKEVEKMLLNLYIQDKGDKEKGKSKFAKGIRKIFGGREERC